MKRQQAIHRTIGVAIIVFAVGQLCWADLSSDVVAYYPFDGNANDASGNGHDGTVHGATLTMDRFGNPDSAYHFDGIDDYIEVPNAGGAFSLTSAWTIAAWVKPLTSLSVGTSGPVIWKTSIDGHNYDTFGLAWQPGDKWILKLERASDDSDIAVVSSVADIDRWYHLVGTYDGQSLSLYIDGSLDKVNNKVGPVVAYTGPAPLMIGANLNTNHTAKGVFDGPIDDVRIYSRALSATEIQELSVVPVPGAVVLGVLGLSYAGWWLRRRRP